MNVINQPTTLRHGLSHNAPHYVTEAHKNVILPVTRNTFPIRQYPTEQYHTFAVQTLEFTHIFLSDLNFSLFYRNLLRPGDSWQGVRYLVACIAMLLYYLHCNSTTTTFVVVVVVVVLYCSIVVDRKRLQLSLCIQKHMEYSISTVVHFYTPAALVTSMGLP